MDRPNVVADGNWQQPPSISAGLPFTLQMLSSGAGVGIGCGVGVGFISPINLSTVPVLGQASQGISAGLGGLSSWLGTAGASARQAARGLGVPGLDVGAGCGVLAGYYFGAGLMLKPSVVSQVTQATTQLAGQLSHAISQKLQRPGDSSSGLGSGPQLGSSQQQACGPLVQQPPTSSSAATSTASAGAAGSTGQSNPAAALFHGMIPGEEQQQPAGVSQQLAAGSVLQQHGDPVMARLLLQQQADIAVLKKQNKQLRAAVCKLDPNAAVCRGVGDSSRRKGPKHKPGKAGADSGDGLSEGLWRD